MALFLETRQDDTQIVQVFELHEVFLDLLEANIEFNAINESVLRADFSLHERLAFLSEDTVLNESKGIVNKAFEAIKKLYQKLKDFLLRIYNWIKQKITAVYEKITSHEGKGRTVVDKGIYIHRKEIFEAIQNLVNTATTFVDKTFVSKKDNYDQIHTDTRKEIGRLTLVLKDVFTKANDEEGIVYADTNFCDFIKKLLDFFTETDKHFKSSIETIQKEANAIILERDPSGFDNIHAELIHKQEIIQFVMSTIGPVIGVICNSARLAKDQSAT
jgi:hypothetical protein